MVFSAMQHIPLAKAYLCEDCHEVGNCEEQCPACASTHTLALAGILNRETTEKIEIGVNVEKKDTPMREPNR